MDVQVADGFLYVRTPYNDREFVQNTLNGVWSKSHKAYRFPKNLHCMKELLKAYPLLQTNPDFMVAGQNLKAGQDRLLQLKTQTDCPGDDRLRPYQRVDVEYLRQLPSAGIFNEPRTGKTPTSILLIERLGTKENLVVSPASLIWNWTKEFQRWMPEMKLFTVHGSVKRRAYIYETYQNNTGPKVLIISKDTWKGDLETWDDHTFDAVFVDEAHYLRNHKTAQSKAIFAINAKHRYPMTGTPTVKHAIDIWGILHFMYPKKFPSYWQFAERYFIIGQDYMGHALIEGIRPERQAELQELIGFISVQRKRSEVMSWLPAKQRIPFYVEMGTKQRKLYDQMVEDFMAQDGDVLVDTANVLAQLTRMRQICLEPRLLGFDAPSAKTEALLEWLDDNREPVVIMSMFTSYLKLLKSEIEKLGLKVTMIHGEMSNTQKEENKARFQAGEFDVLLGNIKSAGTGHTLDRAETVIFTDKEWNPSDNEQAEDRVTPTTEERNHKHNIITFQCQASYDETLNRILDAKKSITDIVNEGGRAAIVALLSAR